MSQDPVVDNEEPLRKSSDLIQLKLNQISCITKKWVYPFKSIEFCDIINQTRIQALFIDSPLKNIQNLHNIDSFSLFEQQKKVTNSPDSVGCVYLSLRGVWTSRSVDTPTICWWSCCWSLVSSCWSTAKTVIVDGSNNFW